MSRYFGHPIREQGAEGDGGGREEPRRKRLDILRRAQKTSESIR